MFEEYFDPFKENSEEDNLNKRNSFKHKSTIKIELFSINYH